MNDTIEQRAEADVNRFFGNRLSPEERAWALKIVKEIFQKWAFKAKKSKRLALVEEWRECVAQFDQNLQTRLTQTETPEKRSTLRFAYLFLHWIASDTAKNIFEQRQEMLQYELQGLQHAQAFLNDGETAPGIRELVLILYDRYSNTYHNMGQSPQVITLLPYKGLWSWVKLNKEEFDESEFILQNWKNKLTISPSFPHFTAAFQELLYTIVTVWHEPQKTHRHFGFLPTEKLLAISESLYTIEQAQQNQRLQKIYQQLTVLTESEWIEMALSYENQLRQIKEKLTDISGKPDSLLKRLWWPIYRWQLNKDYHEYQLLAEENEQSVYIKESWETHSEWQKAVQQTESALVDWLSAAVFKHLVFSTQGLEDLPAIALGLLLVCDSLKTKQPVEICLQTWQYNPPWESAEQLRAIFDVSNWQTWSDNEKTNLSSWIYSLERNDTTRRLSIQWQQENKAQPELQTWLKELLTEDGQTLRDNLARAWENANQQIDDLYIISSIFSKWVGPERPETVLATIILGDIKTYLKTVIKTWLTQQAPFNQNTPILEIFNALKYRFTRAINLYRPYRPHLEQTVHNWAQTDLQELLSSEQIENIEEIWNVLERSRIGLIGLTLELPDNWDEQLGKQLWNDLKINIYQLIDDEIPPPSEDEMWPLLETWFQQIEKWMPHQSPSVEDCHTLLAHNEALVQPFFDPGQQRLHVLWLDKNGLQLRELPENCALQSLWTTDKKEDQEKITSEEDVITQWTYYLEQYKINKRDSKNYENWEDVMQLAPVTLFADHLATWAQQDQIEQLTVIFPAPLGQLPWESLSSLENLLAREISVAHWQAMKAPDLLVPSPSGKGLGRGPTGRKHWIFSDPSGQQHCMVKETQWVANYLNTQSVKKASIFEALQNLAKSQHVHLATHGAFRRDDPIASHLSLDDHQGLYFPLWISAAVRIPADLLVLSACESNLNGRDTENLLTPIGIGPALAAAGAKTVVGTLWEMSGAACFFFNYHFYQLMDEKPNCPWHQLATQARKKLQTMSFETAKAILDKIDWHDKEQPCRDDINRYITIAENAHSPPFEDFWLWAGFSVLGQVQREKKE